MGNFGSEDIAKLEYWHSTKFWKFKVVREYLCSFRDILANFRTILRQEMLNNVLNGDCSFLIDWNFLEYKCRSTRISIKLLEYHISFFFGGIDDLEKLLQQGNYFFHLWK